MGKINDDFDEWARQNMSFPEDFLAEAMADKGHEERTLKSKAKNIKAEITLDQFANAAAQATALFKSICQFAGVEFNIDPIVRVTALMATELFDTDEEEEE